MNIRRRTLPNTDLEPRSENPLAVAVAANDRETLSIVRHAVDRQEVVLAFQPVIQARQPDRPAFYEGLIRIYDDRGRVIPAGDFIDAVEATVKSIPPKRRGDPALIEDAVSKAVRAAIDRAWGKRPIVKCIVTQIDG